MAEVKQKKEESAEKSAEDFNQGIFTQCDILSYLWPIFLSFVHLNGENGVEQVNTDRNRVWAAARSINSRKHR